MIPPTERQARVIWFALTALAIATVAALLVALIWGLGKFLALLSPVLWPLAVAAVVACLLDPVVDFLQHHKVPRTRAILVVFVAALALVTGVLASVAPQVVFETRQLAGQVPEYNRKLQEFAARQAANPPAMLLRIFPSLKRGTADTAPTDIPPVSGLQPPGASSSAPNWAAVLDGKIIGSLTERLVAALPAVQEWMLGQVARVGQFFGVLAGLALIPVYTFYFLLEKRGITANWTDYLPVRASVFKEELVFVLDAVKGYLVAFFRGQVLVAICDGILYTLGFLAVGLHYAFLLGFLAMFLTMIPFLGAITTCALALVLAFLQYGDWLHPALVLAVFAVVQTIEGLVISPKIIGDRVGLHPLAIIIAVMAGTTLLGGLLGGILAIPLTAALRVIMFRYVWKKRAA